MRARGVGIVDDLIKAGGNVRGAELMKAIEVYTPTVRPPEVLQPRLAEAPAPPPNLNELLNALQQNHYRLVNEKRTDQVDDWNNSFNELAKIHKQEWENSVSFKGVLKELIGKSGMSKERTARWRAEQEQLKIDLQEKYKGEIAELEKRYNDHRLETIELAYPPPAYE